MKTYAKAGLTEELLATGSSDLVEKVRDKL
jgi:hypothetical protein